MSLNHLEAIPVDTHVLRIASEHYLPVERKTKSITIKRYNEIGDVFREVYGSLAGWAQTGDYCYYYIYNKHEYHPNCNYYVFSVLFCADLTKFKENDGMQNSCSTKKKQKIK